SRFVYPGSGGTSMSVMACSLLDTQTNEPLVALGHTPQPPTPSGGSEPELHHLSPWSSSGCASHSGKIPYSLNEPLGSYRRRLGWAWGAARAAASHAAARLS